MIPAAMLGLEWARPLGLAALGIVPIVWLLASRNARPPRWSTGTLEVWREVTHVRASDVETRRKTSLALWLLLASLVCGALALGGPRDVSASSSVTWRVVLDRSPSMYLPLDGEGGVTRIERALAVAREQLDAVKHDGDDIEWLAANGSFSSAIRASAPPSEWLVAPSFAHAAPRFELFDRAGTLLVTDVTPQPEPRAAGWCASGGEVLAGVISGATNFDVMWSPLQRYEPAIMGLNHPRWFVRWPGFDASAAPLREVFGAWSAARVVQRVDALNDQLPRTANVGLEIAAPVDGEIVEITAARDGWRLRGKARAVAADSDAASESWLTAQRSDGSLIDVVRWRPGRIEVGLIEMSAPEGDSAAFAVSWAKLFDAAMLPPPGVVAVDERQAAGVSSSRAPTRPDTNETSGVRPYDAWLALAAAACAVLALLLRR